MLGCRVLVLPVLAAVGIACNATAEIGAAEVDRAGAAVGSPSDAGAHDAGANSADAAVHLPGAHDAGAHDGGARPADGGGFGVRSAAREPSGFEFSYEPPRLADGGRDGGIAGGSEEVTLLVIFDKSGSMGSPWMLDPETEQQGTRWTAASTAMLDAVWPHRKRVTVGALLFPQPDQCMVPGLQHDAQFKFMPAEDFIDQWVARADENGPHGSTPMEAAFVSAGAALDDARAQGLLEHRLEVVVLTDGMPNCESDVAELERLPEEWREEKGVRTTVMGLPGSEGAKELLDDIAAAGGTGEHQTIGSPRELEDAVGALI